MVRPIIRRKSYVGRPGKSMKAVELAVSQRDIWRNIASLTMSAVSSTFEAHQSVQSEERHFALVEAFAVAVAFALPTKGSPRNPVSGQGLSRTHASLRSQLRS